MITESSSLRFVSDTEKADWNAKAETDVATSGANGLMAAADKSKLDGVATGANNYSHPGSHAATMITEDSTHRFTTDTEKTAWNGKLDKAGGTVTGDLTVSGDLTINGTTTSIDTQEAAKHYWPSKSWFEKKRAAREIPVTKHRKMKREDIEAFLTKDERKKRR